MTHDLRERSRADGQPIRLYDFQRGVLRWTYCGADRDIAYGGLTYLAKAINDDGIRQSGETSADALTITAPWDIEVVRPFRGVPPSAEIGVTVRDMHYGETEAIVSWVGSISTVKRPAPNKCEIVCQSLSASMDRSGLTLSWSRNCPFNVFDASCKADRNAYKVAATVQDLTGAAVSSGTFASRPDGWFSGGYIEWDIGSGEIERRGIEDHAGSTLNLLGGSDGVSLGLAVTAYPGCSRVIQVCNDKFNNSINYGGIWHMPGKSPFDGTPIF